MGLESGTFIADLVTTNPVASDPRGQGDDHLRLIKAALQGTIPNGDRAWRLPKYVVKTAAYTAVIADDEVVFLVDTTAGAVAITLPGLTGSTPAWRIRVVKTSADANQVSFVGTVNGGALANIFSQNTYRDIVWTGSAFFSPAQTGPKSVPFTNIQDISATSRVVGRKTAGAGVAEELTLSDVLDFIGSAAKGDILFRDTAGWARLAAGILGQALYTGAAANPSWGVGGGPMMQVRSTTLDTIAANVWTTRTLTSVLINEIPGASMSLNQFTLPAGTYWIDASPQIDLQEPGAGNDAQGVSRLQNITDTATLLQGPLFHMLCNSAVTRESVTIPVKGRFTLSGTKLVELQSAALRTAPGGVSTSLINPPGFAIYYLDAFIWKIG